MKLSTLQVIALRTLCENIVWTHKIHEKQADVLLKRSLRCRLVANVLLAVSVSGVLAAICFDGWLLNVLSALLMAVSLVVSVHRDSSNFEALAHEHSSYAKEYLRLRERAAKLISCLDRDNDYLDWLNGFESLQNDYLCVCDHAPRTSEKAVREAKCAIVEEGESSLDKLLDALARNVEGDSANG